MVGHSENGRHDDWDLAVAITGAKSPYHQQNPNSLVEVDPKLWRGFRREVLKN